MPELRAFGRWLAPVWVPVLVALALAVACDWDLALDGQLSQLERASYDLRLVARKPRAPSNEILVVYVDDASVKALEMPGASPPRALFARAIDNALDGGATVVGLDYLISTLDPTRPDDKALIAAYEAADGWLVLAMVKGRAGSDGGGWMLPADPTPHFSDPEAPPPARGFINVLSDADGHVREARWFGARWEDGALRDVHSFALKLFLLHKDIEGQIVDRRWIEAVRVGEQQGARRFEIPPAPAYINYIGPARSFDHVSFADLVAGRVPKELLDGRAVLIGDATTTRGGADFIPTPFSQRGLTEGFELTFDEDAFPGVDVHANALQMLIDGKAIKRPMRRTLWIAALLSIALGVLAWLRRPPWLALAVWLLGGLAYVGLAQHMISRHDVWLELVCPLLIWSAQLAVGVVAWVFALIDERRQISRLFGRYVSGNVVSLLLDRVREGASLDEFLAGKRQTITVLFSDVRGFTSLSEHTPPETVAAILKRYFNEMIRLVREEHQGTMDKLLGDGLMAFFNAPIPQADHTLRACLTALDMRRGVHELQIADLITELPANNPSAERLRGDKPLAIGVGIHCGSAIVGDLGSDDFADYTALGDTVNLAARLESLTKNYGVEIIISEDARAHVEEQVLCRRLDRVQVKGRRQPVWISEVLCLRTDADPALIDRCERYQRALDRREAGRSEEAIELWQSLADEQPDDTAVGVLLDQTRAAHQEPPA